MDDIKEKMIELIVQFSAQNSLSTENGLRAKFRGECTACYKILNAVCAVLGIDSTSYTKDIDNKIEKKVEQLKARSIKVKLEAVKDNQLSVTTNNNAPRSLVKNVKYTLYTI